MVLKYIEHVLESGWVKPFSIPNYPTKTCVLASTAFAIQACGFYDFGSNSGLLAGLTLLAVNLRSGSFISYVGSQERGGSPKNLFLPINGGRVSGAQCY